MNTGHYNNKTKTLEKSLKKYLKGLEKLLIQKKGIEKTQSIIEKSTACYPDIIKKMPFFNTPMYDQLIVLTSQMMAVKKGMKGEGFGVDDFVDFMIENFRISRSKIPKSLRNMLGKIFLSKLVRVYLKKVAKNVSTNGWPTELITGRQNENFSMKICTKDCQMVNFIRAIGEDDFIPYCSFVDFANAESLGYSLKQTSKIDSGVCTFCFNKKGKIHWPDTLLKSQNKSLNIN